jgi:hypothetical protein
MAELSDKVGQWDTREARAGFLGWSSRGSKGRGKAGCEDLGADHSGFVEPTAGGGAAAAAVSELGGEGMAGNDGGKENEERREMKTTFGLTVMCLLLGLVGTIALIRLQQPASGLDAKSAYRAATNFVSGRLSAPASALFAPRKECAIQERDGKFYVKGHVDAQNGFGALLRKKFEVEVSSGNYVELVGVWNNQGEKEGGF